MRILVSDTTWNMATVSRLMRDRGFLVSEARDAADILHHLEAARFDAVLLDPDLPDMDIH
ncbi:MAG: response regulator [Pseudooceanicola sp.]